MYSYATPKSNDVDKTSISPEDFIIDNGFTASSFVKNPANWGTPGKVHYKILSGHSGKAIYPHSSIKTEWEVLIDRGSVFQIEAIDRIEGKDDDSPDTFYVITSQVGLDHVPHNASIKDYYSGDAV